ncbi:hypothetical protein QVD17_42061 [Tagetes erecta]|uniref:Uncharacterized protein n=1 Tax=Tagetes erecta TaxID=13708 RepID=A0AAD8NFZ2_TARER|nr:hypothetical protein QVD17_42061 [Tagetes erecta]
MTRGTGKRSKNKNQNLKDVFKKNSRQILEIAFEKGDKGTYIDIGPNSSNFNSLVGTLISKIPYHYSTWKEVPSEHTCTLFDELQEYFDLMSHLNGSVGAIIRNGLNTHFGII